MSRCKQEWNPASPNPSSQVALASSSEEPSASSCQVYATTTTLSSNHLPLTPFAQMAYDTPLTPQGAAITSLPVREQLRRGLRDMGTKSYSSAKNFAMIGALYSGTECCIEGYRAKSDLYNSVSAGCVTGAILAYKAGPQAAALGCGGFAAFSAAIDAYMRMPESD